MKLINQTILFFTLLPFMLQSQTVTVPGLLSINEEFLKLQPVSVASIPPEGISNQKGCCGLSKY
jgi:hypothetical protein